MSAAPWIKHVRHAVWAAALTVAVAGVASNAWAQAQAQQEEDDLEDSILNADKKMLNTILKPFGLGSASGPDITYRERSPLVVPKGRDLPPPGKVAKGSDWPVEPELKEKRKAAALRKSGKDPDIVDPAKPISGTSEVWKTGDTGSWTDPPKPGKEPDFFSMMFRGKLQGSWDEKPVTFEGETPRTSLIQPPPGYLTPSPAAPYSAKQRGDSADIGKPVPLPRGQDGDIPR